MSYQGYGGGYNYPPQQPPPGQYPPPQQGQYPPPQGQYPPPQQGHYPPPQQGHYPPPQQGQYPPPQQGHYPPPQQGQYPPPQQGGWQQPPPAGQYPPPAGQYPPPQQQPPYGQAPPPQSYNASPQPYGQAPPPALHGNQYPPTPASPGYGPSRQIQWDGGPDAQALRGAMKGFGTDEKTLIRVLANKDPYQVEAIRAAFHRNLGRDLVKDIRSETSGYFEKGLVQLVHGPQNTDVWLLHDSMDGPGTKEKLLNDILLGRSNADLQAIKHAYKQVHRRNLEDAVKGDLSMKTERHFMMVLACNRAEDSAPVIPQQVDDDVNKLYQATEGRMGTDELTVCSILTQRNDNQIRAIDHAYSQRYRKDLEKVIKSEFSGHMEDALLFQLRHAVDKYMHAATQLEDAMAGMGTKDDLLLSRVIRAHWDQTHLANVKGAYQKKYGKSLAKRIAGETSGDYQRLLLACVGER